MRKIIHVDMDAFFAAVEERDFPKYRGKPIIVGGNPNSRGVVSTCNYVARKYGIHSAMPSSHAFRLCPHAIFLRGRYDAYREASETVMEILQSYSQKFQPVSIDEAYLDVSTEKSATLIAKKIKNEIYKKTKLTASAGVSFNKFLAKTASKMDKPNGLFVIPPEKATQVLENLPIGDFHGIGKVTAKKMKALGIRNGKDLKQWSLVKLIKYFGKIGPYYYDIVRGIDKREVEQKYNRKSLGKEKTFRTDIGDIEELKAYLKTIATRICQKLQEKNYRIKTISLKIKYANFEVNNKSFSGKYYVNDFETIYNTAVKLLLNCFDTNRKLRLIGISTSNLLKPEDIKYEQLIFDFFKSFSVFDWCNFIHK